MTLSDLYVLLGHVAHDETPQGPRLGGTVSYAGSIVEALSAQTGIQAAIVTSARKDEVVLRSLPAQTQLHLIEAPASTVFVNTYVEGKRHQVMPSRANLLTLADIPLAWRAPTILHLGPLDDEVDPDIAKAYIGTKTLVAATPQGWMRAWDANGLVYAKPWEKAEQLLPMLDAVVFSEEDIHWDKALEAHYAALAALLVVTRAAKGCTVYQRGQSPFDVPAPQVSVIDATGAGDVFAGTFLTMLKSGRNIRQAAEIATHIASLSVTRVGLEGIATPDEIASIL